MKLPVVSDNHLFSGRFLQTILSIGHVGFTCARSTFPFRHNEMSDQLFLLVYHERDQVTAGHDSKELVALILQNNYVI